MGKAFRLPHIRDGVALERAEQRKARTYPELSGHNGRTRLIVLAIEIGGRWNSEGYHFIRHLAKARSRQAPEYLQKSVEAAFLRRWLSMIACAAHRALALSLLDLPSTVHPCRDGPQPNLIDVLADNRWEEAPSFSRLH